MLCVRAYVCVCVCMCWGQQDSSWRMEMRALLSRGWIWFVWKSHLVCRIGVAEVTFDLRWAGSKGDGSKVPIKSLIQIKDSRFVYKDADNKLLVVVEWMQSLDKVVTSSGQSSLTNSYSCEVCHKFQGDSKSMWQHQAGHVFQTRKEWIDLYEVM